MRATTTRITATAAAAAGLVLGLGACGGDDGSGEAGASGDRRQQAQQAALKFARCMRENGVQIPDPQVGERGGPIIGGPGAAGAGQENVPPAKFEKAEQACRKHLEAIRPPDLSPEQQRELRERMLKFARCMREHGIDFPDPQIGEGGEFRQRIRRARGGADPRSPKFQKAREACQELAPFRAGGPGAGGATTEVEP